MHCQCRVEAFVRFKGYPLFVSNSVWRFWSCFWCGLWSRLGHWKLWFRWNRISCTFHNGFSHMFLSFYFYELFKVSFLLYPTYFTVSFSMRFLDRFVPHVSFFYVISPRIISFSSAKSILFYICSKEDKHVAVRDVVMLWVIWNNRNNWI